MKAPHRKTLIKEESWVMIDDWYWCPLPSVDKRVKEEGDRLDSIPMHSSVWYSFYTWKRRQYATEARVAHACKDGRIRAPSWFEYYRRQDGAVSIHGKCRNCGTALSDGLKGIILMEKEL